MESWQVSGIRKRLPELISYTLCDLQFLLLLIEKGVLHDEEKDKLLTKGNNEGQVAQAKLFYAIIRNKRNSYEKLLEALAGTEQWGAHAILTKQIDTGSEASPQPPLSNLSNQHRSHLQRNLEQLSKMTSCGSVFIAKLESLNLLSDEDVSLLYAKGDMEGNIAQSKMMYNMIIEKGHGFYELMEALDETRQTGSLHILNAGNIYSEENSLVVADLAVYSFEHSNTYTEVYIPCLQENKKATAQTGNQIVYEGYYGKIPVTLKKIQTRSPKVCQNQLNNWEEINTTNEAGSTNLMRLFWWAERVERSAPIYYVAMEQWVCDLGGRIMELKLLKESNKLKNFEMERKKLTNFIYEAATGLQWLHNVAKIGHGNITPANIFICENRSGEEIAKLGNFGESTYLQEFTNGNNATENWMSPEVLTGASLKHFMAQDIFCLGMTAHVAFSMGDHPFRRSKEFKEDIPQNIANQKTYPLSLEPSSYDANHAIKCMMNKDPESRPNITQVVNHPFFWKWKELLEFLVDVARCFDDPNLNSLRQRIDEDYESWNTGINQSDNWTSNISDEDVKVLFAFKNYPSQLIMKLVQFIRDKYMHYKGLNPIDDRDKNMFWENDTFSDKKYAKYFLVKFPNLIIYLFCTLAKEQNKSLGELDHKYFKIFKNIPGWEELMQWVGVSKKTEFVKGGARSYYQNLENLKRKVDGTKKQPRKKKSKKNEKGNAKK